MTPPVLTFGATLRAERYAAGLSLRKLAQRLGVTPAYISRVEGDLGSPLSRVRALEVAAILERDPGPLLDALAATRGYYEIPVMRSAKGNALASALMAGSTDWTDADVDTLLLRLTNAGK